MPLVHRRLNLGPLDNNTYVLASSETREAAVIDVGFEPEAVLEAVRKAELRVVMLLATHAHYDHVAGMAEVQRELDAAFWMHPADRPLLDRLTEQGAMFGFPPVDTPHEVRELAEGQHLVLGPHTLDVLHTPWHSPGHVVFRHGEHVWSGDLLFAGSVGRTDLPGGSWPVLERSIRERLFTLGDAVRVHCGHGPETTIGQERVTNPFVGEAARLA